ncbi:MAG: CidA/LrgA family protein [Myxococcaceae bacterium]
MTTVRTLFQVALLGLLFVGCDAASRWLHLPLPGNVVGVLVLLALLATGVVRLAWIERGADLLLASLSLFFVPAVVASVRLVPALRGSLGGIAVVMVATTALVMVLTGVIAERLARRERK